MEEIEKIGISYFCDPEKIEQNAKEQLERYLQMPYLDKLCAFTDIHYCDEKAIPVGVAFSTSDVFYPLVTGKDLGCGVSFAKISKEYWKGPFDKSKHYIGLEKAHRDMTDDGLGGGNHFLSIEEEDTDIYVICHTGSRNRGIAMYQRSYELTRNFSREYGSDVNFVGLDYLNDIEPKYMAEYNDAMLHAYERRLNFVKKTIIFLQRAGYIKSRKEEIPNDYLKIVHTNKVEKDRIEYGELFGTPYTYRSSTHNHLEFRNDSDQVIHRKGSTEINPGDTVAIPLSMTRGTLIVKAHHYVKLDESINYCAHGAGRKLSRSDAMKYWRTVIKEKERKQYRERFSELLQGNDFPSGYIQEFDYAYKDSSEILTKQPYLKKVTQTTPIVTIKYTEI